MAWTTPKTWSAGEALTAALMNTYMRDNQLYLLDKPKDVYTLNEAADYTTAMTSFVDVDATNLNLSITPSCCILVGFRGSCYMSGVNQRMFFNIALDGANFGADDGLVVYRPSAAGEVVGVNFTVFLLGSDLNLGIVNAIKLRWKVSAGTVTMFAGAGSASGDIHGQFWARGV